MQRRQARKEAKEEYKDSKKAAKQQYKDDKKEANALIKDSNASSPMQRNVDGVNTTSGR